MVRKSTPDPFNEILARKGFAIFAVDNRGSARAGSEFQRQRSSTSFGAVELKDQLTRSISCWRSIHNSIRTHCDLGLVGWRVDDVVCDDAFGSLSRGSGRGSGDESLNYDSIYTERYWGY